MLRILQLPGLKDIEQLLRQIKVDPYGIKIMAPKALDFLIKVDSLSCIEANILKQEMLSLGADAAVSRGTLIGKSRKTDCLLIGNMSQYNRLGNKLNKQPFGLNKFAVELRDTINNYQKNNFLLNLSRFKLNIRPDRTFIVGIVNLTPDSFSADGLYESHKSQSKKEKNLTDSIIEYVCKLVDDGADIIDVGGESSRPGAVPVSLKVELARTIPIIKLLAKKIKVPISIDTYKPEVAMAALDNGAVMVNDISGLKNPAMIKLVAKQKSAIVIMHSKGCPENMQNNPNYKLVIEEIIKYLDNAVIRAQDGGINKEKIVIDPGIGFGKSVEHNLQIIKNLKEFKILGRPILIGTSRKSFIGRVLNAGLNDRLAGTISTCILAAKNGANFLRVHDVGMVQQAIKMFDAVNKTERD